MKQKIVGLLALLSMPLFLTLSANSFADDNEALLKRGKILFFNCRGCHTTEQGGVHRVGPNLHGLIGATIGKKEDFVYSEAMTESEAIWDASSLDAFMKKPADYFPGTKMAFVGIESENDRKALLAYLVEATK